jgi:RHS repeat-associated protein
MPAYYNVHRWYEYGTGRYTRPDPAFNGQLLDALAVEESFGGGGDSQALQYGYAAENPVSFVDPLGLAHCLYKIREKELKCRFEDGSVESVDPSGVFSGWGPCQDNPICQDIPFLGPIKPGLYRMNPDERPGHETWWRLEPVPKISGWKVRLGLARGGFALHSGKSSLGCINVDKRFDQSTSDYTDLYNHLLGEADRNRLHVIP